MSSLTLAFTDDLPDTPVKGEEIQQILDQLKERPGEWALVRRNTYRSFTKQFPGAEYHRHRVSAPGSPEGERFDIYLRWPDGSPTRKLIWQDPPTFEPNQTDRRRETDKIVEQLKKRPGRWAIVEQAPGTPNNSRAKKWKDRGLEARVRTSNGTVHVYARWPEP